MSAPLKLSGAQLQELAAGLALLTKAKVVHGVDVDPWGSAQVSIGGGTVRIGWDADLEQYVLDDVNGD